MKIYIACDTTTLIKLIEAVIVQLGVECPRSRFLSTECASSALASGAAGEPAKIFFACSDLPATGCARYRSFAPAVYAKWGHFALVGNSSYDCRFVTGSAHLVAVASMSITPSVLLPPARDVSLVE
jgi:hypothetical protein